MTAANTGTAEVPSVSGQTAGGRAPARPGEAAAAAAMGQETALITTQGKTSIADIVVQKIATAGLTGHPDQPALSLAITIDPTADLARLCSHLTGQLLPSLRASIEQPALSACLRITVSRRAPRTTRPAAPTLHGSDASQPPGTRPDPPRARTRPPAEADLPVRGAAPPRGCGPGAAPAHTLATRAADRQPPQAAGKQGPAQKENPR